MDGRGTYPIRGAFRQNAIIGTGSFQTNAASNPASSTYRGSLKNMFAVTYSATGLYLVTFTPSLVFSEKINVVVSNSCADMTSTNFFVATLKGDVSSTTGAFTVAASQTVPDAQYGTREYTIQKILDAVAGTNYTNMGPVTNTACTVTSVTFGPDAAVTADNTNYKTLALVYDDGAGGSETTIASVDTTVASGSWVAGTLVTLAISGASVPTGKQLKLKSTKAGSGVALAGGTCTIKCTNALTSAVAFAPPNTAGNRIFFSLEGLNL